MFFLAVMIFAFQYRLVEQNRHIGIIRSVISRHTGKLNKCERIVCTIPLLVVNALLTCSLQERKIQKFEITMEVGGWVQVSLGIFFLESRPEIALNQYWYFGDVYYVYSVCTLLIYMLLVII